MEIKKLLKSKTIDTNAAILAAVALVKAFGIDVGITPEQIATVIAVINIILRFFTTKPVAEK